MKIGSKQQGQNQTERIQHIKECTSRPATIYADGLNVKLYGGFTVQYWSFEKHLQLVLFQTYHWTEYCNDHQCNMRCKYIQLQQFVVDQKL